MFTNWEKKRGGKPIFISFYIVYKEIIHATCNQKFGRYKDKNIIRLQYKSMEIMQTTDSIF
jgi:hypothetical protein